MKFYFYLFLFFCCIHFPLFAQVPPEETPPEKTPKGETQKPSFNIENQAQAYIVERLILKADQLRLHKERYWLLLLHYLPNEEGSGSEADGKGFFFSDKGKYDPRAELHADLRAFFEPPQNYSKNKHPQCLFPARFRWLKQKLDFGSEKPPLVKCPALEFWLDILDYDSLSIVFASYFLNAPASAFGHTLLKINSRQFKGHDLLSYSVNYAAATGEIDFFRYALLGLFGGFEGRFGVFPYHVKVKEYNDMEDRDIWEYPLNLKKEEINRMLVHVWELEHTYFDYYFLKENCGYHILSLLEAARPSLNLRSQYSWVTLPGETLKLLEANHLIKKTVYRPAANVIIEQRIQKLNPQEKEVFYSVLEDKKKLPKAHLSQKIKGDKERERKIFLLDTLLSVLRSKIEYTPKDERESGEYKRHQTLYEDLLKERTKLPPTKDDFTPKTERFSPHLSHDPFGLSLFGGLSSFGFFGGGRLRPLLHELLNVDKGYPVDSELLFLSLDLRWYEKQKVPVLYRLDLLKTLSLVPYDSFSNSISYGYSFRIDSEFLEKENDSLKKTKVLSHINTGEIEAQLGYAFDISEEFRSRIVLLAGGLYRYAPSRSQNQHTITPAFYGMFLTGAGRWRTFFQTKYYPFSLFFSQKDELQFFLGIRYAAAKNNEVLVELRSQNNYNEAAFRWIVHL